MHELPCVQVSTHTITILLGLVFSVINPLLPLICVVYFAVVYLLERYNMLYSERPTYHAGGKVRNGAARNPAHAPDPLLRSQLPAALARAVAHLPSAQLAVASSA